MLPNEFTEVFTMATDMKWFDDMEARIPRGETRTRFAPSPTG